MVRRLPNDLGAAVEKAELLNAELDRWYRGEALPPKIKPYSLQALHNLFQDDPGFERLKPRTQQDYLYCIKPALSWAGDQAVTAVTRKALRIWYRDLLDRNGAANARNAVAALRRLLSFGVDEGWLALNPALKMQLVTPPSRTRVWTLDERDRFVEAAQVAGHPSMAQAVLLGWCLGQRPDDLRRLTWSAYDGHSIELRQAKTGTPIRIPCLPELKRALDAASRISTQIVVSEVTGRPYGESAFQHRFAKIRKAAGLPDDLNFRDLRRTLATALGAAGCTDDQIRAVTGHKTRSVVAVYVRPDDTFARAAMARLQGGRQRTKKAAS